MQHTATYSPDDNKIRIYPACRLDADEFARVKAAGFKWAPKQQLFVAPTWSPNREDVAIELCGEIGDDDTSLVQRAEERAERFDGYSDKRMADAERARKAVAEIADNIPLGQPILVGHHSEKHARRDKEKIDNGMRKAVKMWKTSQYWTARAAGALQHAKYKELPTVRARRIKTIEADKRKVERSQADSLKQIKAWQVVAGINDAEKQRAVGLTVANHGGYWSMSFPLADYPRDPPASQYEGPMGLWSAINDGVITAAQAAAIAIPAYERALPHQVRWIEHYENRLAYEKAMLDEAGASELLAPKPRSAKAQAPLLNYRAEGGTITAPNMYDRGKTVTYQQVDMTKAEYARINQDYKGTRFSTCKTHRFRTAMVKQSLVAVYLTDSKDHGAPKAQSPSEFVAENVARPEASPFDSMDAALNLAAEIAAEAPAMARSIAAEVGQTLAATPRVPEGSEGQDRDSYSDDQDRDSYYVPDDEEEEDTTLAAVAEIMAEPQPAPGPVAVVPATPSLAETYAGPVTAVTCPRCGSCDVPVKWLPYDCDECGSRCTPETPPAAVDSLAPSPATDFEAMERMLKNGGGAQVVVAPQLFPTSADLAAEVAEAADLEPGQRILEPSAGTGALIEAARAAAEGLHVVAVEINSSLACALADRFAGLTVINSDFMDMAGCTVDAKFDKILMNPPFERGTDIQHIEHARKMLRPGGRLVAICADGPRQRERYQRTASEYRMLPAGSFKHAGTMVNTALVVIDAPPG